MKKFLCLTALCLAMLTAGAIDFVTPTPYPDVGYTISQQSDNYVTEAQVQEYVESHFCSALFNLMPVSTDFSVEYVHVMFKLSDAPLCKTIIYSDSEPPNYSCINMNGNAVLRDNKFKRRHC